MKGGRRLFLFSGLVVLLALAGCGRSMLLQGERPSWRYQAEAQCMQSGAVKISAAVAPLDPIDGPGMCGANFPLKVAALGESSTGLGYNDAPRPPAGIRSSSQMPDWQRYERPLPPPAQGQQMRWVPGAPPANAPQVLAPQVLAPQVLAPQTSTPQISAPQVSAPEVTSPQYDAPQYNAPRYESPQYNAPAGRPVSLYPQGVTPPKYDDIPDDAILPQRQTAPRYDARPAYNAPAEAPPPQRYTPPALGPSRGPASTGAIMPATVTPAATLSCPIVSALERWVTAGVQPAAMHWFGVPVAEIKQISAYSCRGMVGAGTSRISEHAFGNALDIAGFVLADGRKIIVKNGWRGTPEEQGFLHDVQLYACQTFNTVLAPGYNAAHYDHIHVDLMRRKSGRRPCRPEAIPGEVVAAKARAVYASRQRMPSYTGSITTKSGKAPAAIPGEDGLFGEDDADDAVTGSIPAKPAGPTAAVPGADGEFDDDDVTGSIGWPRTVPPANAGRKAPVSPQDRMTRF